MDQSSISDLKKNLLETCVHSNYPEDSDFKEFLIFNLDLITKYRKYYLRSMISITITIHLKIIRVVLTRLIRYGA